MARKGVSQMRRIRKRVRTRGRQSVRSRRRTTKNKVSVTLGQGFPKRLVVTHKYAETFALTSTTGIRQMYQFSANGLFDPNITGTGHQPMYFDQCAALYNHYTVIGSRCTAHVTSSAASEDGFRLALYVEDDTSITPTGIDALIEQSSGHFIMMAPNTDKVAHLKASWSAKKNFGGSVLADTDLKGTPAANPADQSYYSIAIQGQGSNTTVAEIVVVIEYIAVWSELKSIDSS